jgi:hypothetical protein
MRSTAHTLGLAVLAAAVFATPVRADDPPPGGAPAPGAQPPAGAPAAGQPPAADPNQPKKPEPVKLADARAELERLKTHIANKKADNADILASLEGVMKGYANLVADVDPPDDKAKQAFDAGDGKKFKDEVEKELVRALKLVRVNPKSKANERDEVNIAAAKALGSTSPSATTDLIAYFETIDKQPYEAPTAMFQEGFKSIGMLGDMKAGWKWLNDSYLRNIGSEKNKPDRVKAAYDAAVLFRPKLLGKDRHQWVKENVGGKINWLGIESQAGRNGKPEERIAKEIWDKVKSSVIRAVQVMAGEPKDDKGALIATMVGFDTWLRAHDSPKDPAWQDEKHEKSDKPEKP